MEWCGEVPFVGYNSGSYDLNVIKEHFVERLVEGDDSLQVAKKANKIYFILDRGMFKSLDIINYQVPGTSYESWLKAHGQTAGKSRLPYEWFDSAAKLDYEGLPP